jgi:CheY-like chemotaxis protein
MNSHSIQPFRCLLVEDDDDHADLIRRAITACEMNVLIDHVHDGREAMEYLHREGSHTHGSRPDLILVDLKLNGMSGHDVITRIKSNLGFRDIPVVVLTTSSAKSDRDQAYQLHANSYVVKPTDFVQLHRMMRDLIVYWSVWNSRSEGIYVVEANRL